MAGLVPAADDPIIVEDTSELLEYFLEPLLVFCDGGVGRGGGSPVTRTGKGQPKSE